MVFAEKEEKYQEQLNNQSTNQRLNQPTRAGDWVIASGARESQFRVILRTNSAKTRTVVSVEKGVLSICASNIARCTRKLDRALDNSFLTGILDKSRPYLSNPKRPRH